MIVRFKENRFKKLFRNGVYFSILIFLVTFIFRYFDLTQKTYWNFFYYYIFGIISLCLSTKKITLVFDESNQLLRIYHVHILGGGKQQIISYENLSYKEYHHDFLMTIFQKSELVVFDALQKKAEITNLDNINDSDLFLKKLSSISNANKCNENAI